MATFYPSFSIHLICSPFQADVSEMSGACALRVGGPGEVLGILTLFFPADKLEQVKQLAALLNELSPAHQERAA